MGVLFVRLILMVLFSLSFSGATAPAYAEDRDLKAFVESAGDFLGEQNLQGTSCELIEPGDLKVPCSEYNKKYIKRIFKGSLFIKSPYKNCSEGEWPNDPFTTGRDLKDFYESNSKTALGLYDDPSAQTCEEHRPRKGRGRQAVGPTWDETEKFMVSDYYYSLHRLQGGMKDKLQEMAQIDALLNPEGQSILDSVDCNSISLPNMAEQCHNLKKPSCKSNGQIQNLADEVHMGILAYQALEKKRQSIYKHENRRDMKLKDREALVKDIRESQDFLKATYPWLKSDRMRKLIRNHSATKANTMAALKSDLKDSKAQLNEKYKQFNQASRCIRGLESKNCKNVLSLIEQTTELSPRQMVPKTRSGLTAGSRLSEAKCMSEVSHLSNEVDHLVQQTTTSMALTVATFGVGAVANGARLVYLAQSAAVASKSTRALTYLKRASHTKRGLAKMSMLGVDAAFFSKGAAKAIETCNIAPQLVEQTEKENAKDFSKLQCPEGLDGTVHAMKKDFKACIVESSLAALGAMPFLSSSLWKSPSKGLTDLIDRNISHQTLEKAEELLGYTMGDKKTIGLMKAHLVGSGKLGADGKTIAAIGNYTQGQKNQKLFILMKAGFTREEAKILADNKVVGKLATKTTVKATKVLLKNEDEIEDMTESILRVADDETADPDFRRRILEFGSNCVDSTECIENNETRQFLEFLTPENFKSLPENQKSLLDDFSKMCIRDGQLTCSKRLLDKVRESVQQCLKGCDEATEQLLHDYMTPFGHSRLPRNVSPPGTGGRRPRPANALGEEYVTRQDVKEGVSNIVKDQNELANGLHHYSDDNLVINLDVVHKVRHRRINPKSAEGIKQKELYDKSVKPYLEASELTNIMRREGLSPSRTPDLLINGNVYDVYQPQGGIYSLGRKITSKVVEKVEFHRQTNRLIIDATDMVQPNQVSHDVIKKQLRDAHFNLSNTTQPGKAISNTYKIPTQNIDSADGIISADDVIKALEKRVARDGAFKPGELKVDRDSIRKITDRLPNGTPQVRYEVRARSSEGLQHTREVTVILGTRQNPMPVQVYPFFDEGALDRALLLLSQ